MGASVPPPERWPGYQLTRVRLLRQLSEEANRPRARGKGISAKPEVRLEAPGLALVGRVDRIERSSKDVELVDLKSGWGADDDIRPAHRRQLLIYAYLWQAMSGNWPTKVSVNVSMGSGPRSTSTLWVPVIRSSHATCAYSWISPPSRSRRTTPPAGTTTADSSGLSGGTCPKARCGRCTL
jgi:hypothetical protein